MNLKLETPLFPVIWAAPEKGGMWAAMFPKAGHAATGFFGSPYYAWVDQGREMVSLAI